MNQQFGGTKLTPVTDADIANISKNRESASSPPPVPNENDPFVAARRAAKAKEEQPVKPKADELGDKAIDMHPILKKLKRTLGINKLEIFEETIYANGEAIKWGLTEYPEELNIWCASEARTMSANGDSDAKAMKAFDILRVGCSLVYIDQVPTYEIYGINVKENEIKNNKFDLSNRLRQAVAIKFYEFVIEEGKPFIDILEDFWQDKILNRSNITSSKPFAVDESVYICPVAGCSFTHVGKSDKTYYCIDHSVALKKALTREETVNLPLA